jgi:hypothetical protein
VNTFKFSVSDDVKTLKDMRRLLRKADLKIAAACKVLPELNDQKVAKARITAEQPKQAATAAA